MKKKKVKNKPETRMLMLKLDEIDFKRKFLEEIMPFYIHKKVANEQDLAVTCIHTCILGYLSNVKGSK